MFCSECGVTVSDDAKFCGECGAVQTTAGLETTATAFNRMQSCPSCNVKGWEHGKQCRSCGYVEGEKTSNRNKLQASVTSPSSGKSSSVGIFLLWALIIVTAIVVGAIMLVGFGYIAVDKLASDKTETAQEGQSNQVENVSTQTTEEKARLAAEGERMRAASVERERTVGKMEQEQLSSEAEGEVMSSDESSTFYKPKGSICSKVTGISQNYAEGIANKYSVSARTISFIRFANSSDKLSCDSAIMDTPNGPKLCFIGSIVKNKNGEFLIHPYRKSDDGFEYVLSGNCTEVSPYN